MLLNTLIFVAIIAVAQCIYFCPPNETPSIFTCGDRCIEIRKTCTIGFVCVCKAGYKRNNDGRCIPIRKCCPKPNEVYCETESDNTCEDVIIDTATTFVYPPYKISRCCCKEGTVRDKDGNCVQKSECYPKCTGENEVYKVKGCDSKCDLKGVDPSTECELTSGCFCKDGYVRQNGTCIRQTDCKCDGPNECYLSSGGCEQNCEGINCLECPGPAGCYCMEGFVRNSKQICILQKYCKKY